MTTSLFGSKLRMLLSVAAVCLSALAMNACSAAGDATESGPELSASEVSVENSSAANSLLADGDEKSSAQPSEEEKPVVASAESEAAPAPEVAGEAAPEVAVEPANPTPDPFAPTPGEATNMAAQPAVSDASEAAPVPVPVPVQTTADLGPAAVEPAAVATAPVEPVAAIPAIAPPAIEKSVQIETPKTANLPVIAGALVPEEGTLMPYYIERGDTLAAIAGKILGSSKHWKKLAELNKLSDPSKIYAGDVIYYSVSKSARTFAEKYEASAQKVVTVKKGDSLATIARTVLGAESEWRTLWKMNTHVKNPDLLKVGTILVYREVTALALEEPKLLNDTSSQTAFVRDVPESMFD